MLRAETSCNIYWGEAWVHRAEADSAEVAPKEPESKEQGEDPEERADSESGVS